MNSVNILNYSWGQENANIIISDRSSPLTDNKGF